MPIYTKFQGVDSIGRAQVTEQLSDNMISFLNNGFLSIGAFYNVSMSQSGVFNNPYSRLRPVSDPSFSDGRVWEGFRANWVWEKNIEFDTQPNGVVVAVNSSVVSEYKTNYPLGRVVFNSALPTTSRVEASYSYRYINTYSSDTEFFRQIQTNSLRSDINFMAGSGSWNVDVRNRVQLPAVFVDVVPNRRDVPKEIGGGIFINQDIIFHVVSETASDRKRIMDILANQREHKIYLFDKNAVGNSFPLSVEGYLLNNNSYANLVDTFPWRSLYFADSHTQFISDYIPGLHMGDVRATVEIDYGFGV